MTRDDARTQLSRLVSADTQPILDATDLDAALDAARVRDVEGRAPVDTDYVETFDLHYAAAEAFTIKATRAAATDVGGVEQFTSEGATFKKSRGTDAAGFLALADLWRGRSGVGGGVITVIGLESTGGFVPRSAEPFVDRWHDGLPLP